MKKFTYIGTWRMAFYGLQKAIEKKATKVEDFVVEATKSVEDYPYFKSVGYGGLPNEKGQVELDAAFMDGKSKNIGAIMGVKNIKNPIEVALALSKNKFNRFLVGKGAEQWAFENGFAKAKMETPRTLEAYKKKLKIISKNPTMSPYDGHDTVCFLGTDTREVIAATSTSGLFMKKEGRVGDSPLPGSGFYADNEIGACAATGLGEDIARGVLSYKTVDLISQGLKVQEAVDKALFSFIENMKNKGEKVGPISLIALDTKGNWGISTNCLFQFAIYTDKTLTPELYIANPNKETSKTTFKKAPESYWKDYIDNIKKPIVIT